MDTLLEAINDNDNENKFSDDKNLYSSECTDYEFSMENLKNAIEQKNVTENDKKNLYNFQ